MSLDGRTVLLKGVSRRAGIGFAIARHLVDAGASVFVQGWTPHATWRSREVTGLADFRRLVYRMLSDDERQAAVATG